MAANRVVAGLIWISGLGTTSMFFWQLGMRWFSIPVAIITQAALTRLQSPIWSAKLKNLMISLVAIFSLIMDVMFNSAGVYEFVLRFNETNLGGMLVEQGIPVVSGLGFLVISMIIGIFQAGAPEILWNMDSGTSKKG